VLDLVNQMSQPVALQTDTHSRGFVKAVSTDAEDPPSVTANYFADPRDWASQQQRFNALLSLGETDAMLNYTYERKPFPEEFINLVAKHAPELVDAFSCFARSARNDEYTRLAIPCLPTPYNCQAARDKYLRDFLVSSYHYFGTAAAGSVVDGQDFSVKGTQGLHVVDASVIPFPTTVNPQGTVMALGHYVGKLLAERQP